MRRPRLAPTQARWVCEPARSMTRAARPCSEDTGLRVSSEVGMRTSHTALAEFAEHARAAIALARLPGCLICVRRLGFLLAQEAQLDIRRVGIVTTIAAIAALAPVWQNMSAGDLREVVVRSVYPYYKCAT